MNRKYFNENRTFLFSILIIILELGIFSWYLEKGDMVVGMNSLRSPSGNIVASYLTMMSEGWVFVVVIILLLFYNYASSISMLIMSLSVLISSYLLKMMFHHPRPIQYLYSIDRFNDIKGYDEESLNWSHTSFPSGHTFAAFSLAIFLSMLFPKQKYLFIILAGIVAMTRIYLVQHFLEDVVFGAFCGVVIGILSTAIYYKLLNKSSNMRKSLKIDSFLSKK